MRANQLLVLAMLVVGCSKPTTTQIPQTARKIFAHGTVEGRTREAVLQFETTGRVTTIAVRPGQFVEAGDVLATIDSSVPTQAVAIADAALAAAVAKRQHTEQTLLRMLLLRDKLAIAQQDLDDAQTADRLAVAERDAAQARLLYAQATLAKATLHATYACQILDIVGECGELQLTIVVADTSETRVRAFVEQYDALNVVPRQRGYVTVDGSPAQYWGAVVSCGPRLADKTTLTHKPGERANIKVREIILVLDEVVLLPGLPVDVFLDR